MLHGAIASLGDQIAGLERESARLVELLAAGAFSGDVLARISKKLDRIRSQLEAAKKKLTKCRRALNEAHAGLDDVEELDLEKVESSIERIERYSTGWAKALEAMEVLSEMGSETSRRVSLKGGERRAALDYAESSNPTTAFADLASSATGRREATPEPKPTARPQLLGRHLNAVRSLEQLVVADTDEKPPK